MAKRGDRIESDRGLSFEQVVAEVTGTPRPLARQLARRLDPRRYTGLQAEGARP